MAVKIERAPIRNMAEEELKSLGGDVRRAIRKVAEEELAADIRRSGRRPFTLSVDGKRYVPPSQVKKRIEYNFLGAIGDELQKTLKRLTRRRSYVELTRVSGNLGEKWEWFYNGRPISDPKSIGVLGPRDQLWIVSNLPYGVRAQKLTREAQGKSILSLVARTMRRNRLFKDYKFFAVYPEIQGHRRPAISIKLRSGSARRTIGA